MPTGYPMLLREPEYSPTPRKNQNSSVPPERGWPWRVLVSAIGLRVSCVCGIVGGGWRAFLKPAPIQRPKIVFETIAWSDEGVVMIDQRKLPAVEEYPVFKTHEEVAQAIKDMVIRGAPAIGVAAAMGVALGPSRSSPMTRSGSSRRFSPFATPWRRPGPPP